MNPQTRDGPFEAVVQEVVQGKHGPYAVALVDMAGIKRATFALKSPVWEEGVLPEPGTVVVLNDFRKKRAGWRAESARFYRPSDEQ